VGRYSARVVRILCARAKKDGKEYIIESKTNSARIRKSQLKLIEYAKELGYISILIKSRVEVTGEITEIKGTFFHRYYVVFEFFHSLVSSLLALGICK